LFFYNLLKAVSWETAFSIELKATLLTERLAKNIAGFFSYSILKVTIHY